ncbi:MAG TPA: hypothetical protein VMI31_10965, partial [Fimbriimonadaceae bacterium]|nr:hypothetical protein [Fimbriimonadaceae bacterium]
MSFLVFAGCLAVGAFGQGYVGADGALKMIAAPERPKPLKAVDPAGAFWRTVGAYIRSQTKLSSKVSAARWIALAERCPSAEAIWELDDSSESLFPEVIAALPGPSVWPEIERQLKEQVDKKPEARDVALLALAETLGGKSDAAWNLVGGIKGLGPEQAVLLTYVEVALALREGNKDRIEQAYRREADAYSGRTQPIGGDKIMNLPDLSVILGPSRARSLLADIFRTFDGEVNIERGDAFKKMAREVALAGAAKLKHPQWTLALDPDAGPLFEAMHRQFPDVMRGTQRNAGWSSDTYSAAAADYMIYLVAHGRVDDATAFVKHQNSAYWYWQVPENETSYLAKLGKTDDFIKFLEAMIQGGKTTLLQDYSDFCREIGQSEREKQFVAQLPEATRAAQRDPTYEQVLDLASKGQIEQACSLLVKRLEAPDALKSISNSAPNSASQLFDIGQFLHRKDYTDLALKVGEEAIRTGDDMFIQGWVWQALLEQNRGPEAERIVADSLQRAAHSSVSPPGGKEQYEALIQIYAKAGRWADVVTMLEDAPNWGVTDVAFLNDSMKRENAVPFIAARALAGVGRKQEALRVLLFVLNAQPDLDQAYELLLSLDPKGAETILDRMHRTSPMATRPLMWKAKLLQNESRLADAEALIRQAIAID